MIESQSNAAFSSPFLIGILCVLGSFDSYSIIIHKHLEIEEGALGELSHTHTQHRAETSLFHTLLR